MDTFFAIVSNPFWALLVLAGGFAWYHITTAPPDKAWSAHAIKTWVAIRIPRFSSSRQPTQNRSPLDERQRYRDEVDRALALDTQSLLLPEDYQQEDSCVVYDPEPAPKQEYGMSAETFLHLANHSPDIVAHVAVHGPTGSGKTSLVSGLLASRKGKICIFTPKPVNPRKGDPWGGLPRFKIDKDATFTSIVKGLHGVMDELRRRMTELENPDEELERLTIILDDYQVLAKDKTTKDIASEVYYMVSNVGRELEMCLIVIATTSGVRGLNIEGYGDARDGFLTVRLKMGHTATVIWEEETLSLETDPIVAVSRQPFPHERVWMPDISENNADVGPFSHNELRLAVLFTEDPGISFSEATRRLYPSSNGSGRLNQAVQRMYQRLVTAHLLAPRSSDD